MTRFACPVAVSCGGCPGLITGDYAQFVQTKFARLEQLLRALEVSIVPVLVPAENPIAYRRRIRLRCTNGRVMFFNPDKDVNCTVLTPGLRRYVKYLFELSAQDIHLFMGVSHLEVRDADLDGMYGLSCFGPGHSPVAALELACNDALVVTETDGVAPVQRVRLTDELDHFVPLRSFIQINEAVNHSIQSNLNDFCVNASVDSFWDLYCGVGNLSLRLAASGMSGGGVEINAEAVQAARRSVLRWSNLVDYQVADARTPIGRPPFIPGLVIANPPRAGLKQGIEHIAELGSPFVFLMSCSLDSLRKDLAGLMLAGYEITEVRGYDMFPFTSHLETTVIARRV